MTGARDHMTAPALPRTLRTQRLTLRPFGLQDLEAYVAYYTGPRTAGVGGAKPRHVVAERFHAMAGQWTLRGFGRYAMDLDGQAIGHVGVIQIDDSDPPEMTWTLWDAAHEGQGYATEAARAVMDAWTGPRLLARIERDNAPSLRIAARLGFVEDPTAVPHPLLKDAKTLLAPEVAQA